MRTIAQIALALAVVAGPVWAGSVTVELKDSGGGGLAGGNVYYYQSGWKLLGTTDGSGTVTGAVPDTKRDIELRYAGGRFKWVGIDVTTGPTLSISTVPVTVKLQTCGGTPLTGEALYYYGGWQSLGSTPATVELLPYSGLGPGQGSYDFQVKYEGRTSATTRQDVSDDAMVVIKTTKVSFNYNGPIWYYNHGWMPFTNPMEMVGGPGKFADFKFGSNRNPTVRLAIEGCEVSGMPIMVKLLDSHGGGLAGGNVVYWKNGQQTLGTTGADGTLTGMVPVTSWTDVEIRYAGGRYKWTNVNANTAQPLCISTIEVTVRLVASDLVTPLVGDAIYYWSGWQPLGHTDATVELLPYSGLGPGQGSYDFQVKYGGRTSATIRQDVAVNPVVVFNTTQVTSTEAVTYCYIGGFTLIPSPFEMIGGPGKTADFKFGDIHNPTYTFPIVGTAVTVGPNVGP